MESFEAQQLRIYVDECDQHEGRPVYEALVTAARDHGLEGATVYRGVTSYGRDKELRTAKILRLSEHLPLIVEIIDTTEKLATFMPVVQSIVSEGLVTMHPVNVVRLEPK